MNNLKKEKVAVIGSGLSAIGAIRALVTKGIKPIVLDTGIDLDENRYNLITKLKNQNKKEWRREDIELITQNYSVHNNAIPKKLAFGSDYFYGKSNKNSPIIAKGDIPPLSYAIGGLSSGWGATALPPNSCDLNDWPISSDELDKYHKIILDDLPYSAQLDGLSKNFELFKENIKPLKLSKSALMIKKAFDKSNILKKNEIVYGQARLLINSDLVKGYGYSMSGCIYGSIYKAADEINQLVSNNKIIYLNNCLVDKVNEFDNKTIISFYNKDEQLETKEFDRVFIAAGAANSSRIILNSLKLYDHKVKLKSRGGYVLPMFSFKKLPSEWPDCSTHPDLFIELNNNTLKHWVHIQISTENELIRQRLNIEKEKNWLIRIIKKFIVSHVFVSLISFHSNFGGHYEMSISKNSSEEFSNTLYTKHKKKHAPINIIFNTLFNLIKIFIKMGAIPVLFMIKHNSSAYHVGGTMPMRKEKKDILDTDTLGRIGSWERIHIIDSSIFPSLPGTTIGLLLMSNAYRIVNNIYKVKND